MQIPETEIDVKILRHTAEFNYFRTMRVKIVEKQRNWDLEYNSLPVIFKV